jgi:hypothetical protein
VDEMQGSGATGALQVSRVDGRHFVKPDSALVRTALGLLAAHVADRSAAESAVCGLCGLLFPCRPVRNARQVVSACGVDRLADNVVGRVLEIVAEPAPGGPPGEAAPDSPVGEAAPDSPVGEAAPDSPAGRVSGVLAQLNSADNSADNSAGSPVAPGADVSPQSGPVTGAETDDEVTSRDPVGAA